MSASPRRHAVPPRIRAYIGAVVAVAVLLAPLSRLSAGAVHGPVAALIAGSARRRVQIGLKRKVSVGSTPEVAAMLLLPDPLALAAAVVGLLAGERLTNAPIVQYTFNAVAGALRVLAGLLVYALVLGLEPRVLAEPAAMLLAAAANYLCGAALVWGIAAMQLREIPLRRSWADERDMRLAEAALCLTGIIAAMAAADHAWTLPLLLAPAVIAQRAVRDGVALQAQTRLALEELADIVDMRDHYTFEHSRRVAELARATARRLGRSDEQVELITMSGRVHDVGKIGIKSSVLMKPGRLTDGEWQEMRSHAEVGARLIAHFPRFAKGRELVLHHHERFDGTGYPRGLKGDQIPFGARVLAVADAWDAMTSHRAYRRALDLARVREELQRCSGTQFDPVIVTAFLAVLDERPDLAIPAEHTQQDVDVAAPPEHNRASVMHAA